MTHRGGRVATISFRFINSRSNSFDSANKLIPDIFVLECIDEISSHQYDSFDFRNATLTINVMTIL